MDTASEPLRDLPDSPAAREGSGSSSDWFEPFKGSLGDALATQIFKPLPKLKAPYEATFPDELWENAVVHRIPIVKAFISAGATGTAEERWFVRKMLTFLEGVQANGTHGGRWGELRTQLAADEGFRRAATDHLLILLFRFDSINQASHLGWFLRTYGEGGYEDYGWEGFVLESLDIEEKVRPLEPMAATTPPAGSRFWHPSQEVEQWLAWLEKGLLEEFGNIEDAVLTALAEVDATFDGKARQRYKENSGKIRERGELWSMSSYLREDPLNHLGAAARVSPEIKSDVRCLQVRAKRCSKAFSHLEMIRRLLKFREAAVQNDDKNALSESDDHMKWRLFELGALTLNAHRDPAWGPLGRIIDGLRESDARCFRELLHAVERVSTDIPELWKGDSALRGIALRHLREEAGLTQLQLAEKVGVAERSIQRYEEGKTAKLGVRGLIFRAVRASPNELNSRMRELGRIAEHDTSVV